MSVLGIALAVMSATHRSSHALGASYADVNGEPGGARRISLVARDEPVREVLLRLGLVTRLGITIADDVRGNVTLSLHDVTVEVAVHAVCSQLQLRCVRDGRTVMVYAQSSAVVPLSVASGRRAAQVVRQLFPRIRIRVDERANVMVLVGSQSDIQSAHAVIQGIDVRDATKPVTEGVVLRSQPAAAVAQRLRALYPSAKIEIASRTALLLSAAPPDLAQIKALVASIDMATPAPTAAPSASEAVKVLQRRPQDVARAVTAQLPRVRAAVSGATVTLAGPPDDVARAKSLVAQLDVPSAGERYTQVYRIRTLDASSVADLLRRSFRDLEVTVDASLNAIAVSANGASSSA